MKYELFDEVALAKDIPEKGLKRGDVATIVELHSFSGGEDGYSRKCSILLAIRVTVVTVPESCIEPLDEDEIPSGLA